jgi:myo-inositol-1(or 4)-monophosphatase
MGAPGLDLAWTAAGRYDGFWQRAVKPWEMAAGVLIAKEASLSVESLSPGVVMDTGDIIVATDILMPLLKERVA